MFDSTTRANPARLMRLAKGIALTALMLPALADACSCIFRTFAQHYCDSDAVVEAQLLERTETRDAIRYKAEILRRYKGRLESSTVEIVTPPNSAQCGVELRHGPDAPSYLLTASIERDATGAPAVLRTSSCDFQTTEPSAEVQRFLANPTCGCGGNECRPWQECKRDTDGAQYCADTCNGFPCPDGQTCELQDVVCVTSPCPPVAHCVHSEPLSIHQVLRDRENGWMVVIGSGFESDTRVSLGSIGDITEVCIVIGSEAFMCPEPEGFHGDLLLTVENSNGDGVEHLVTFGPAVEGLGTRCPRGQVAVGLTKLGGLICEPVKCVGVICPLGHSCDAGTGECSADDVCKLPPVVGPCDAAIPAFYHNARTGLCTEFTYGGCGGNANRFSTLEACQRACVGPASTQ